MKRNDVFFWVTFSQFEEKFEDADGVDQPMVAPVASSTGSDDNNPEMTIEPPPQHVQSMNSDPNLPQDSPSRIMRIVPSDVDVIL